MDELLYMFPTRIQKALIALDIKKDIEEIRLARNRPVILRLALKEYVLQDEYGRDICIDEQDMQSILCIAGEHSLYFKEDEINSGYLTLKGGYRMGLCGTVSYKDGSIIHHGSFTSINIRIPREVRGCAKEISKEISRGYSVYNTVIVSPPKKGKTTILRDLARIISDDLRLRIGIVDERKELWGNGKFDLGIRSDVLCGCKKTDGIMMLIRTMSPDVIIVDELGNETEFKAVRKAMDCGVNVIASVHGSCIEDILEKSNTFEAIIILGNNYGEYEVYRGGK